MKNISDLNWKMVAFCATTPSLILLFSISNYAQTGMSVGAGFDVLMPVAVFGNHYTTGFGSTGEFDYVITPKGSLTGKIGYLTWSEKNLPSGVSSSYNGVPLFISGKYYPQSIPKDLPVRLYGHLEIGFLFGSVSASGNTLPISTKARTDFTIAPSGGMEIPVTDNGAIDLSIHYFSISSKASVGLRGGYKMSF